MFSRGGFVFGCPIPEERNKAPEPGHFKSGRLGCFCLFLQIKKKPGCARNYHAEGVYEIRSQSGMESTRSVVWHQSAGLYGIKPTVKHTR